MLKFDKQEILKTFAIIWFVAATAYFVFDQYNDYKVEGLTNAYNSAIYDVIKKVKDSNCQTFELVVGNEKTVLVNAECLQQMQQPNQPPK